MLTPDLSDTSEDSTRAEGEPVAEGRASGEPVAEGKPVAERRGLIVAGMHRSGTSAVTRVLALLGASLPLRIGPPASDNEPGFWEPLDIVEMQMRMLRDAGSDWDDVSAIDPHWLQSPPARRFQDAAVRLLEREYDAAPLFVLKDPRLSRLVPFWLPVLERFGAKPYFVICIRNPLEVAASLNRRNGFTAHKGQLLWLRHLLDVERHTRELPRTFVAYDELLRDWPTVVERMARQLEIDWPRFNRESRVAIDRFLSTGYRHHNVSDQDLADDPRSLPIVKRLHRLMMTATEEDGPATLHASRLTLDGMFRELEDADRLYGPVLTETRLVATERLVDAEAAQREAADQLEELRPELDRLGDELAERDRALRAAHAEAAERQSAIEALRREVESHHDTALAIRDELQKRDASLQQANLDLVEQRRTIESLRADLANRDQRLDNAHVALTNRDSALSDVRQGLAESERKLGHLESELATTQGALGDARERLAEGNHALEHVRRELAGREETLERLRAEQSQREQALAQLQAGAEERERALAAARAQLEEAERRVDELRREIGRRDAAAEATRAELSERTGELKELRAELAERERLVERRGEELAELAARVEDQEARLGEATASAQRLSVALEAAQQAEEEVRSQLAERERALAVGAERIKTLNDQVGWLQAQLTVTQDELLATTARAEEAARIAAESEARLRGELSRRVRALEDTAAREDDLSARVNELESMLAARERELHAADLDLRILRAQRARSGRRRQRELPKPDEPGDGHRRLRLARWSLNPGTRHLAQAYHVISRSGAFDAEYYLSHYRDVARSGMDPVLHYLEYGVRDRYDPSASFSTSAYLEAHPELLESGINPLFHALMTEQVPGLPGPGVAAPSAEGIPIDDAAAVAGTGGATERTAETAGEIMDALVVEDAPLPVRTTPPSPEAQLADIPRGAIVLLGTVNGQDDEPPELAEHRVWTVPIPSPAGQSDATAAAAVRREIESLRAKGGGYLVLTRPARERLQALTPLAEHLAAAYRRLADTDDLLLYELAGRGERRKRERTYERPGWSGLDVICLPIIDWTFRFQRPQQLMAQMARHGHRVFYVATTFQRQSRRPSITELADNVWGVRLPGTPETNIYTDLADEDVTARALDALGALREMAHIDHAITVVDLPFWAPIALGARSRWGWKTVYDCMDEHGGFLDAEEESTEELRRLIDEQERRLLASSDLVLATSRLLHEKVTKLTEKVVLVPNAADYAHFARGGDNPLPPDLPRPVVGYYGAIASWFDSEMIGHAARQRPDWSFVLAGRTTGADLSPLEDLENVHLLGELPYGTIPGLLHQFDVACIPFHLIDLTLATNPVKFYEYLSAGKPVVSVELPELAPYPGYWYPVRSDEDFVAQVEAALAEDTPDLQRRRRELGATNTWEIRYETMTAPMRTWYGKASIIIVSFNNPGYLRQCLDSLWDKTGYPNFEVIVVDNGSPQELIDELTARSEHEENLRVLPQGENQGFARANNIGIAAADPDSEYIVLLNDDTVATPNWLGRMIGYLQDERIGLVGPVTNWTGNEARIEVPYGDDLEGLDDFARDRAARYRGTLFDLPVLAMYCVAMRKSVIERIGGLDERFGIGMFEDDDFAMRIRRAGQRVVCAEDVFIHHWGRASFKRMSQEQYDELFEENKRIYEEIWSRPWIPHRARVK